MATAGVIEGSGYILKLYFRDFCDFIFLTGRQFGRPSDNELTDSIRVDGDRGLTDLRSCVIVCLKRTHTGIRIQGRNEGFEDAKRELICLVEYTNTLLVESNAGFSALVVVG
jgi:hypothetical protein